MCLNYVKYLKNGGFWGGMGNKKENKMQEVAHGPNELQ